MIKLLGYRDSGIMSITNLLKGQPNQVKKLKNCLCLAINISPDHCMHEGVQFHIDSSYGVELAVDLAFFSSYVDWVCCIKFILPH